MPTSPHTQQFLDAFRLTETDLEQNRRGTVSPTQIEHSRRFWRRVRLGAGVIGVGSMLFAFADAVSTRVFNIDTISPPLIILGVISLVGARVAHIRKQQIASLPLHTLEDQLEIRYERSSRGRRYPVVYRASTNERIADIPSFIFPLIAPNVRYRIYSVGLEVVLIEPLNEPNVLPVAANALQRQLVNKGLLIALGVLVAITFGLQAVEPFLLTRAPVSLLPMTQLPLPVGHTFRYGEQIDHFRVNALSEQGDHTLVGLSGLITATGTVTAVSNGFAFVPDEPSTIPFPPIPHSGYIFLDSNPLLANTITPEGRWRARLQINLLELSLSPSGNAMRGHALSVTNVERIPEEE